MQYAINESFPNWLEGMSDLDSLYLSGNKISGPLPKNIGAAMPTLVYLSLGSNLINGSIPKSLCIPDYLHTLDLSKNMLSGEIPDCWKSRMLIFINLSENKLSGTIPNSIGHPRNDLRSLKCTQK